jgi:dihydrofolate reductase
MPRISLIAAMARNRSIGIDNRLPWHLPADLKRFKALTMGHPMVIGRRTYDSVGRALPGRTTIVVTRQPGWSAPGVIVAHTLDEALDEAVRLDREEVFVGGGQEIFRLALNRADRIYLTVIDRDFSGDTFFPEFDESAWRIVEREDHPPTEARPYAFSFVTYEKKEKDRRRRSAGAAGPAV